MADATPVFLPASPLQYLNRLMLQNEIFGDDIRLLGIHRSCGALRMVTIQPDISGEPPTMPEISEFLGDEFGFRPLSIAPMGYYKSSSYLLGNLGLFDVHPANLVKVASGKLVPIDVIMVEFSELDARVLESHLG